MIRVTYFSNILCYFRILNCHSFSDYWKRKEKGYKNLFYRLKNKFQIFISLINPTKKNKKGTEKHELATKNNYFHMFKQTITMKKEV